MKSLSGVALGLSVVFGCLLLALAGELYYLLWWKRRIANKEIADNNYSFYMFCLKRPSSLRHTAQEQCSSVGISDTFVVHDEHQEFNGDDQLETSRTTKDLSVKPFGDDDQLNDSMEAEIMRLHGLSGPPRFLFTIAEETKEDLESEDARSRGDNNKKCLSDLLLSGETPFLTPLASPSFFTPPLTPMDYRHNQHGISYLSEVSTDAEFNRMRSSPPPKFKFLQDAEEKLIRKKMKEEAKKETNGACSQSSKDEEDGTFITIVVDKNKEREVSNQKHHLQQLPQYYSSTTSQVIPLGS